MADKTVSKTELAALLGVAAGSIPRLVAAGMPSAVLPGGGRARHARFDGPACLRWQRDQIVSTAEAGAPGSPRDEYLKVLTERARLDLETRRGEVVDVAEVQRDFAHVANITKTRLRGIPSAVATRLVAAAGEGPGAIHKLLLAEIDEALLELSRTPETEAERALPQ